MPSVPDYLHKHYWWAYVHPHAVRFWDRTWLLNLILYGNFSRLRDAALAVLGNVSGRTLQIACCYGDLMPRLARRVAQEGGSYDAIDILPVQIEAVKKKLTADTPVHTVVMDASALALPDHIYDRVLIFFLFHEQPQAYRIKTMREALRVAKPEGKIVIVDFARPRILNPIRLWLPFLGVLEPFANDLWTKDLAELLPEEMAKRQWQRRTLFGGLFQILVGT